MHHLVGTGLRRVPPTCVVHKTILHVCYQSNGELYIFSMMLCNGSPDRKFMFRPRKVPRKVDDVVKVHLPLSTFACKCDIHGIFTLIISEIRTVLKRDGWVLQ